MENWPYLAKAMPVKKKMMEIIGFTDFVASNCRRGNVPFISVVEFS